MLYTAPMNSRPNVPDEIWLGKKDYSLRTDWRVNAWLFAATIVSGASDIMFPHHVRQWNIGLRILVALIPFVAIPLWMRSLARWIGGMDELHRRITQGAILFSTAATFFFVMLWHRLELAGMFQALFPGSTSPEGSWDIATVGHVFLLMTLFYFVGHSIFNRRYK
jgi:hypothetical protein